MRFLPLIACVLFVPLVRAATPATVPAGMVHPPSHARAEPGVVSLDVCADGRRVHLLLAERLPEQPAELRYLRSDDGGATWAAPVTVGRGQPAPDPIHRGMDAQVAARGDA